MAKLNITFVPVTEQNGLPAAAAIGTINIFTNFVELTYEVSDMSINEIWSEFKNTGSTKSFKKLYDAVYDVLFRYASYYLNSLDAEEVVLDLMLYLWTHRKSLEVRTSFEAYLRTSVHNRCLNKLRDNVSAVNLELVPEMGSEMDLHRLAAEDISIVVWEAMTSLSPKCRQVFELSRNGGMKNSEIAQAMGLSQKSVEGYITKSLKQIRIAVKKHLIFLIFIGISW